MKKIGIIYGLERTFPNALIEKINSISPKKVQAQPATIGFLTNETKLDYHVILDRVSDDVPFYNSFLKQAVIQGVRVVNNPFWKCTDDNFYHNTLASKLKVNAPKTAIIPTKEIPDGTTPEYLSNMEYPLNWSELFEEIGFPAILKPNKGKAFYNSYMVYNPQEFFSAYNLTGSRAMALQQYIKTEEYYKCYVVGRQKVRIMGYDPFKPHHLRYSPSEPDIDENIRSEIEKVCIKICKALEYDYNAVEIAVYEGKVYIIDFLNPTPNAELNIVKKDNFNWLVETTANYLIELAEKGKVRTRSYTLMDIIKNSRPDFQKK